MTKKQTKQMKIDKDVPMPKAKAKLKYPFNEMNVGDSFEVPCTKEESKAMQIKLASSSGMYGRKYGAKFTTRQSENGIRIWRTA